jgi:hypothetical protein
MTVHDVKVQDLRPGFLDTPDFPFKMGKVQQ